MPNTYWMAVLAPSVAAGNALAADFSDNPADAQAFVTSTKLYPAGTTFSAPVQLTPETDPAELLRPRTASNPPAAYYVGVQISQEKYEQATAMLPAVLQAGFKVELSPFDGTEPNWREFIESHGYVVP